MLAHRYPFLLVDRIVALEPGVRVVGVKRVTADEWFMRGRADGVVAMPAPLVIEALAQTSGALLLGVAGDPSSSVAYFMGFDRVRCRGGAVPGDELRLTVTLRRFKRGICRTLGRATVDGREVVRAEMTTVIRPAAASAVAAAALTIPR
ncbi:MAG TPA: 3-hydroxyacyl-ACP dehydratase FabZ family protein [Gemmatirosa sp.]